MHKIIFISKIEITKFPMLMGIPLIIASLGYEVDVLAPGDLPKIFENNARIKFKRLNFESNRANIFAKFITSIKYRIKVGKKLKQYSENDIIWLTSADTAIPLIGVFSGKKYILHINELYENNFVYRGLLRFLSKDTNTIVVPEINRANIFRVWFKLDRLPFILPNKSAIQDAEIMELDSLADAYSDLRSIKSKGIKILIYQGQINKDRDLTWLVQILGDLPFRTHLLLVGEDYNMVARYKSIYENVTWIPKLMAPYHLSFTRIADIGIIYYTPNSLNNIFCAPNKIWEFTKYGLPIISNNLPGMFETIKINKAGVACNFESSQELKDGLTRIHDNYSEYSDNALRMYDGFDSSTIVKNIIENS